MYAFVRQNLTMRHWIRLSLLLGFTASLLGGGNGFFEIKLRAGNGQKSMFWKTEISFAPVPIFWTTLSISRELQFSERAWGRGRQEVRWRRAAKPSLGRDCMTHNETKMKTHIYMGRAHTD